VAGDAADAAASAAGDAAVDVRPPRVFSIRSSCARASRRLRRSSGCWRSAARPAGECALRRACYLPVHASLRAADRPLRGSRFVQMVTMLPTTAAAAAAAAPRWRSLCTSSRRSSFGSMPRLRPHTARLSSLPLRLRRTNGGGDRCDDDSNDDDDDDVER
jgi:hypothetical protein